jgi:glycosyltransferase involved in cell wall biosynthesis
MFAAWNPMMVKRLHRAIDDFRPDVAHVHNTWFAMSPAVIGALKKAGLPVVMTLHNYRLVCANGMLFRDGRPCEDCVGSSLWSGIRHACYRDSHALSIVAVGTTALHRRLGTWSDIDVFIALTEFQRNLLIRGGLARDRVVIKSNSVTDPGARPEPPSKSNTVLYAGRLSAEKGVDLLVDAWQRARPPGLELLIVGDGPLRSMIEVATEGSSIRIAGTIAHDAVLDAMLTSRALVFPSKWYEGAPLSILEAFSAGLPVLASNLGGTAEIVGTLGEDHLVNTQHPDAWASALQNLTDSSDIDESSVRARAIYEERFSPGVTRGLLEQILQDAMVRSRLAG